MEADRAKAQLEKLQLSNAEKDKDLNGIRQQLQKEMGDKDILVQ